MSIITKSFLLVGILFSISGNIIAQKNWREIISIEDICEYYPEVVHTMFDHINLEHHGLEKVKTANSNGNIIDACNYLLEYYKNSDTAKHLNREQPEKTNNTVPKADTILNDVFVIQNVGGQVPYSNDGHRDWYYKGPENDKEWAWLSNRHSQINSVLSAYFETGNPKYAEYIDLFLRDFIIKSMPYPAVKSNTSVWRGLEVSFRGKVWSRIFYSLVNSEYLSPSTQILILSSLPDHAHYLRNFHAGNNWLTMEISALATIATNFPEFRESGEWLEYSTETMIESMKDQVYPDGVQTELTSHYHNVSLSNFELFKNICSNANKALPDFYNRTIEKMYGYIAHAMRPSGFRILNNDGDIGSDRNLVLRGSKKFNNTEWEYIATNGNSGTEPSQGPSTFYPWAGHLISRSGYDADAHWSFFDMGPWGSGHQHNDKLHISISAYGRDLLVDAGRFAYTGEVAKRFRRYARSSAGHNVLLIDNKGQNAGPAHAEEPLGNSHFKITDDFDYASNSFKDFTDVDGDVEHIRSIFYVRGEFWVVVDRIITDKPRIIEALWHWHPTCVVEKDNSIIKTNNKKGNLAVIPVSNQEFNIEMVKGRDEPEPQGWYSPEYNIFEPNIASYHRTNINESATIVWLLMPSEGRMPETGAEIISEKNNEILLIVKSEKNKWQLTIPFTNSNNAKLIKN